MLTGNRHTYITSPLKAFTKTRLDLEANSDAGHQNTRALDTPL